MECPIVVIREIPMINYSKLLVGAASQAATPTILRFIIVIII